MVLKIGHRGACGYEPENTLLSFEKAISLGADMVELDVRSCKSGEVVVFHDDKINNPNGREEVISELSLGELKLLDLGKGEKIPTLKEVFGLIARRIKINIELKGIGITRPVVNLIEEYITEKGWSYEDFLVSSFKKSQLVGARELNPNLRLGYITDNIEKDLFKFLDRIKGDLIIKGDIVDKKFVELVHKKKFKILIWTLNKKEEIEKFKKLKVDGIFSDFPDRL